MSEQENNPQDGQLDGQQEEQQVDHQAWVQEQHAKVLRYGSRNQLDIDSLHQKQSAVLPPHLAIWLARSKTHKQDFWIITGDLPTDHVPGANATNAREAVRHFCLRWQLKADKLLDGVKSGKPEMGDEQTQTQFAELLISRANGLHDIALNDDIWGSHPVFSN